MMFISENISKFSKYLEFIYPRELENKGTSKTITSSSYLDLYLYIDNEKLITGLYDKQDDYSFRIVYFAFLSSNIPSAPAYGVYNSQLTRYARASLRKHAYSNILKILPPKKWKFSDKNSDIFHISAQNIDCGYSLEPPRQGGSNEYPQSMFWAEIRKIMYTPVNPSFTI